MGDFVLGPLKVVDNGDGVYQAPVSNAQGAQDQLVDLKGQAVKIDGPEAKQALQDLGISSLQGLKLSPASRYLDAMSQATGFSTQGDILQTQQQLDRARIAAVEAKLAFSETRAAGILKTSLEKGLDLVVAQATKSAAAGDVLALQDALSAGREILSRLQVPLDQAKAKGYAFTPDFIDQQEVQGYAQAVTLVWKQAESAAQAGNIPRTQEFIGKIREYATRGRVTLSPDQEKQLTKFEQKAYEVSIDADLAEAASFALQGDVENTRLDIQRAKDAAQIAKTPLNSKQLKRIANTERTALHNAPDYLLPLAEAAADQGDVEAARGLIQQAKDARREIGLDLSKTQTARAEAAEQKALRLSVDVLLGNASAAIAEVKKNGNLGLVQQYLLQARENAALSKTTFSAAQETSAKSILSQAYQAAVDWRFRQAAYSADLGKVDDTVVPLNAGRELAKQGGLNFDEAAATKLIETALAKGIELEFTTAEKFAKAGDEGNTYFHLGAARDFSKRLGKSFDTTRSGKILKLLPPK